MSDKPDTGLAAKLIEGSSDPQAKQAPADGGMRGERTGDHDAGGYPRSVGCIDIIDTSGVAHAEAGMPTRRPKAVDAPTAPTAGSWPWLFVVGSAIGFVAGLTLRRRPAAMFDERPRIRDAGPEHMVSPDRAREWTRVDEASDESFPASDPPATY